MPNPGNWVPFVENVLNDPGVATDRIFTYDCTGCAPEEIKEVGISLRVRSSRPDPRTGQYREITLRGLAERKTSFP